MNPSPPIAGRSAVHLRGNPISLRRLPRASLRLLHYFAGSQRIAMRVAGDPVQANNGVFYLLGDHLGSTNVVADEDGNKIAELRYKAWGELRFPATPPQNTDYRFTGQREEHGIGLYYYRARWYDPALGRFAQADTIVPGGGPMAWDRYAYVANNPVKYSDPTGHKQCDDVDSMGNCVTSPGSPDPQLPQPPKPSAPNDEAAKLAKAIKEEFGWIVFSHWPLEELRAIYETGLAIRARLDKLTGGYGRAWMDYYMGGTRVYSGVVIQFELGGDVYLKNDWMKIDPEEWLAHELAHVADDRSGSGICPATWCGGGTADMLAMAMGGDPGYPRWNNGDAGISPTSQYASGSYGNHSSADYFAETLRWMIFDESKAVPEALQWMKILIILQADALGN